MSAKLIKIIFCLGIVILSFSKIAGQTNNIRDSLQRLINSPVDTVRLNALVRLTWESRFTDPLQGFEYGFNGLALARKLNREEDLAVLHNYIGVIATKINSFDKAKAHILKAYHLADSLHLSMQKAYALNNLGEIYYQTGKLDSSLIFLKEAIEIFNSVNDLNGLAYGYNQMGMALRKLKHYDDAFVYHKYTSEIREKLNHRDFMAKAIQNMGIDLLEKGDYSGARSYFEKMDTSVLGIAPGFTPSYRLILIGQTFNGEKKIKQAINYYKQAYKVAESFHLHTDMRDAAKLLSDIYKQLNNPSAALVYYNLYKSANDSVQSINLIAEYKQLEMKSVFEQKYQYLEYKLNQDIENQNIKLFWLRILIISFSVFFIIFIIFIVILSRKSRLIAKQNQLLLAQKDDIENKNEELKTQNLQISEQNQAIIDQRDELALANATKDKFFSIIAHDLRGPVGNLTAFFNMVIEGYQDKIDEKLMEFFLVVNESVQQTYSLLENLLTWARLQNGTIAFNPEDNNLYTILDDSINLFKARAQDKRITIKNLLPKELVVKCDNYMIDTVIRNLLGNAIKFTPKDGTISISMIVENGFIEIAVSDTGIGMQQDEIDRLFLIDVRHKTRVGTNGERGTGLGLILCKEFIDRHSGKIWVESIPGKGSTFKFLLPLQD